MNRLPQTATEIAIRAELNSCDSGVSIQKMLNAYYDSYSLMPKPPPKPLVPIVSAFLVVPIIPALTVLDEPHDLEVVNRLSENWRSLNR